MVTEFGLGSYVSYKLYPDNLIYMDGRYEEVYDDREFNRLMDFERAKGDWSSFLKDYPTDILLIQKDVPVYSKLDQLSGWIKVYEGNLCGVYVKKNKAKKFYKYPSNDIEYYKKNEFTNNGFFGKENKK